VAQRAQALGRKGLEGFPAALELIDLGNEF
jgi:hypothetical protein